MGSTLARAEGEEKVAQQFLRDAQAFQAKQAAKFQDLGERFDKVDLHTILVPEALTTKAGMATARAGVAQYRSLLAERRLLLQTYLAEFERFITSLPPGDTQNGATSSMGATKGETAKLYADLDTSQTKLIDAMSSVLDWGAAQADTLEVRNGQLLLSTPQQQSQLNALLAKVSEAEAQNAAVLKVAAAAAVKAQATMRENTTQAEQLLKK